MSDLLEPKAEIARINARIETLQNIGRLRDTVITVGEQLIALGKRVDALEAILTRLATILAGDRGEQR